MNYYQVLQVDRAASQEVIEAAYRRLARMYHPDINKQPDAVAIMQRINEAYAVVGNPTKRYTYDRTLDDEDERKSRTTAQNPSNTSEQSRSTQSRQQSSASTTRIPVACANCGAQDATLRIAAFPYVVSVVLVTFRRAWGGIYCERCRTSEMTKAKLVSFIFGWWGIPFGIFYTLGSIFGPSGGQLPPHENAEFLRFLGAAFLGTQKTSDAQKAFRASLGYEWDEELARAYRSLFGHDPFPEQSKSVNGRVGLLLVAVALAFVGIFVLSAMTGNRSEPPPTPINTAPASDIGAVVSSSPMPTLPPPTKTATPTPQPTPTVTLNRQSEARYLIDSLPWLSLVNQRMSLAYPSTWEILKDEGDFVVLAGSGLDSGAETSFNLSLVALTSEDMTANEVLIYLNTFEEVRIEMLDEVTASNNEWLAGEDPRIRELNEIELRKLGPYTVGGAMGHEYIATVDSGDTITVLTVPVVACGKSSICRFQYIQVNGIYGRDDGVKLLSRMATGLHITEENER